MEVTISIYDFLGDSQATEIDDGERLCDELKRQIDNGNIVYLDFNEIESCVTRFLNPAIGQLLNFYNKMTLSKHIKIKNIRLSYLNKLKAVISNAQNFYSNPDLYKKMVSELIENA